MKFLRVSGIEDDIYLINVEQIETVEDEGGPTAITLLSGKTIISDRDFDQVSKMLTKLGYFEPPSGPV
jgi:uncharacterized protein YlzI (FlbEa/FlbD family)